MDFEAYYRKTYAAWLGKIIGIRLGAPVENWTHKQIMETDGKLDVGGLVGKGFLRKWETMY